MAEAWQVGTTIASWVGLSLAIYTFAFNQGKSRGEETGFVRGQKWEREARGE